MMHLYSALLCIVVHPKHFTIMWGWGGVGVSPQIWHEFQIHEFQYDQSFMYFPEVKVHFLSVHQETKTCLKVLKCFSKIFQGKTCWIQVQAKVCTSGIFKF